ncbi:MAG: glycoside hydrolase family 1 protein [Simkania sp.]|nr:glycoside hydrolase family 1 protein [Simkania sp.]
MTTAIREVNNSIWFSLEEHLTPLPTDTKESRVWHVLPAIVLLPSGILTGCLAGAAKVIDYAVSIFSWKRPEDPFKDFSAVLRDSRLWKSLGNLEKAPPPGKGNPNFLFGAATCTYQDSGAKNCPNSQWANWERANLPEENQSGESANLFQLYQTAKGRAEIYDRLHKLGVNSYRFSIEWSHIEPKQGEFNLKNLQVYVDFCKYLRDHGITPVITLHHFSEPKWFHEMGSFENEENIHHFVTFAKKIFPYLTRSYQGHSLVEHFCTINEPGTEALSRFIRGVFSPGTFFNFTRAGHFLKGVLKAHCVAYKALKNIAPKAHIGIVHQYISFTATNWLVFPVTRYLTRLVNDVIMNFFKTGTFELKIPFSCHIVEKNLQPKTDFVGLQYYVRPIIGLTGPTSYYNEPMTQMPFHEDPEGLYEAILEAYKAFRAPVIVTENGISTHDEAQRFRYMQRALYAVRKAQEKIGEKNLLGYFVWALSNNFEWDMGMKPQAFGAYQVHSGRLDPMPKKGMNAFIKVVEAWKRTWATARAA